MIKNLNVATSIKWNGPKQRGFEDACLVLPISVIGELNEEKVPDDQIVLSDETIGLVVKLVHESGKVVEAVDIEIPMDEAYLMTKGSKWFHNMALSVPLSDIQALREGRYVVETYTCILEQCDEGQDWCTEDNLQCLSICDL